METLEVYEGTGPPERDLAFESWMLDRAAGGQACALISSWRDPVVVLGYGQDPSDVDLEWCRTEGIPVLRRLTGGSGVIHRGDLSLALALPVGHPWAAGVLGLYERFLGVLTPSLRQAGANVERAVDPKRATRVRSPVCFMDQLTDTLLVGGRKAVGCAQTRRRGSVLVHAAILLGLDVELYTRVFRSDPERIRGALAPAIPGGDWRAVGVVVIAAFAGALGLQQRPRPTPPVAARYLEVYETPRWAPLVASGSP